MSRALNYLMQARPEAMSAYFTFLKDAGSRLDPKTRALISVITKVSVQTEKGLIQYTKKALEAGVSADEVLDALMMAFPALGLSRIVWAVEVLLEAEIAGFAEAAQAASAQPSPDATANFELSQLPDGHVVKRYIGDRAILLYRDGAQVRAYKAYCSHQGMELMESGIAGKSIVCKQHNWRFQFPSGNCGRGDNWALAELPVEIDDDSVMVRWQPEAG